jgi:tripartite-type tricarboxylate transporter receptor subunit TctC
VPDFFVGAWTILLAPVGTPAPIIKKIHDDMQKVLDEPEMQAKLALNGGYVRHMTPDEVTAFVTKEQTIWQPIMEQVAREAQK